MLKIKDTRILLALALPLIISGLIEASLGFTSILFLSHLGPSILAAGSLVAWFFSTMMVVLWGLFTAVSVSVSNRQGAKDKKGIAFILRDGFWLAILLTAPITILIWNMAPILQWLGQSQSLIKLAIPYLHALAWSILPDFTGILLLQFIIGLGHTKTNLVLITSWVILNIAANYVFIFGHLGVPALGIAGLGWGTAFSYWVSTIAWFVYLLARKLYRSYFKDILNFKQPYYYWELIKIGVPTGLMWCIEVAFFFVLSLLIGRIDVEQLAASQVAMQYVTLFVSILFAIAQAVTIRVSNRLGAKQLDKAYNAVHSGLLLSVSLMFLLALVAWIFPNTLISIDFNPMATHTTEVTHYARIFLAIGVAFLLLEAVRITLFGALRGLKDTRTTLIGSLLSFWVIAIPLGEFLAHSLRLGSIGLWLGLFFSGFFAAGFLWWRYQVKMRVEYTKIS